MGDVKGAAVTQGEQQIGTFDGKSGPRISWDGPRREIAHAGVSFGAD